MAALGDDVTGGGERIRSGMLLKLQTDVAGFEAKCVPVFYAICSVLHNAARDRSQNPDVSVTQRHLMEGRAARAAGRTGSFLGGAGLDAALRVFHHQRVAFTCHAR